MMLESLAVYARGADLGGEPGFVARKVSWAVDLTLDGRFSGLLDLRQDGRPTTFQGCPDLLPSELAKAPNDQPRCRFLVESASLVLRAEGAPAEKKRLFFAGLYQQASAELPELGWLKTVACFLELSDQRAQAWQAVTEAGGGPRDLVVLTVAGRNPLVHDGWRDWWRAYRAALDGDPKKATRDGTSSKTSRLRDFLSGELVLPATTHPKIKGLAGCGGLPTGDSLISFDKPSFQSYGLSQGSNAALSVGSASLYAAALNHLVEHGAALGDTRVCHWTASCRQPGPLATLFDPTQELEAADQAFFLLAISGCRGRIMVRDWYQGRTGELKRAVEQWFADLALVSPDGQGPQQRPPLGKLLEGLGHPNGARPGQTASQLLRCAVSGEALPLALAAVALARLRQTFQEASHSDPNVFSFVLLKAFHGRLGRYPVATQLEAEHPQPAYQCGRLLAALVWLQGAAFQRDLGRSSWRRRYPLASVRPAHVFPQLLAGGQRHLRKLGSGMRRHYQGQIEGIMACLRGGVPVALGLELQGLFALGYYHQVAHSRLQLAQRRGAWEADAKSPEEIDEPY
jgi:CRISPR-associated protein Csd1